MDERLGLSGRSVLEVGCFEGVHTIALCEHGATVVALDSRVENVAKTAVRAGLYGWAPSMVVRDLDRPGALAGLDADLAHHVGVLYHLDDPVGHLLELGRHVTHGVMLDTHIASQQEASYAADGDEWEYAPYAEGPRSDAFSGMRPTAKWLTLPSLQRALDKAGFSVVEILEQRDERNGPRVLLLATRPDPGGQP